MKKVFIIFNLALAYFANAGNSIPKNTKAICFTENKGQIGDQNNQPRLDILFGGTDGELTFHLKSNGISYQQCRVDSWVKQDLSPLNGNHPKELFENKKTPNKITIYRLDINWLNVNSQTVIQPEVPLAGYSNYYTPNSTNGALEVKSYQGITYQNIYNGIDLKWYQKNGHLKYDYIVAPGANYKNIQLEYNGAQKININKTGELVITTPLGQIVEQAPYVTQNGKVLSAQWKVNKNIVSFNVLNYDASLPLLIDPGVRTWGTYYGGSADDLCWASVTDATGNLFMSGYTSSVGGTLIATVGSHQSAHSGNGLENAMVAKFTPLGARLWATYYGGNVRDIGSGCAVDPSGNVFLSGNTISSNIGSIATVGSHQSIAGGNWDAFLVKFNGAGVRQWGTYYGGPGIDFGTYCAADPLGNVYLCGKVNAVAGNVIATPGSFQPNYSSNEDAFLVKFDPNGLRLWGTFYGVEGAEAAYKCETDAAGNVYMVGVTSSTANMATPGAHQSNYSAGYDGFLVKFNNSGVRQLATYYGGTQDDKITGFCRDANNGNLYICGYSASSNGNSIATDGSHQSSNGGGTFDAFLVQFNSLGVRQWGTYYGGAADDRGNGCAINSFGYVYLVGYTGSSTGTIIATPGSHQPVYGGGIYDAFLTQFDHLGSRVWGSYYGGAGFDLGEGCSTDNSSHVYLDGLTDCATGTIIATPGSLEQTYGGSSSDGFFIQFYDCAIPPTPGNATAPLNQTICIGNTTTLSANGLGTINWYTVPVNGTSINTGSNYITPLLGAGSYTFYAEANTCTVNAIRAPIGLTVYALPNINITSSNATSLCVGQSVTLSATGITSFTWNTGSNAANIVITPTITNTYSVAGSDVNGCANIAIFTQSVVVCTSITANLTETEPLLVFPNPTSSNITLKGVSNKATITVYNSLGEIILKDINENLHSQISFANCSNGIYFIKVDSFSNHQIVKIIKQ